MSKKTPEEIAELKKKYAADNAAKENKKQKKKDTYNNVNLPVIEMRIPYQHKHNGKVYEIDLESPPWDSYTTAMERSWRENKWRRDGIWPTIEVKYKIIRT